MVVWRLGDVKDAMMIPTLKWFVNYKFYFRTYIAVEPSTIVFCWNLLKLCCWNVLVLLLKCYSLSPLCLFKYFDFLVGSPWVPRNPMGLGDGRKTSPAHGDGDGDGFAIFSWGWVWEGKTRWVSSPLPSGLARPSYLFRRLLATPPTAADSGQVRRIPPPWSTAQGPLARRRPHIWRSRPPKPTRDPPPWIGFRASAPAPVATSWSSCPVSAPLPWLRPLPPPIL